MPLLFGSPFYYSNRQELEPEMNGDTPLDMAAYEWMFNTCRIPHPQEDFLKKYENSVGKHILVGRYGAGIWSLDSLGSFLRSLSLFPFSVLFELSFLLSLRLTSAHAHNTVQKQSILLV